MSKSNLNQGSRYRGLILSIIFFLGLIAALLIYTFYTSNVIQKDTALIAAANEASNSGQVVIKDLFDLKNSYGENIYSPHMTSTRERLVEKSERISQLLAILREGGEIQGTTVPALSDTNEVQLLSDAEARWSELHPKVDVLLSTMSDITQDSSDELNAAYEQAKTSSVIMSEALDSLTAAIYKSAARESNNVRTIQLIGVAAIFAYFLIFIFFFLRRLRESDSETLDARRETQEIMQTVGTGLFLLDKDLKIGNQYSNALVNILGTDELAGVNFSSLLRGRISDKDLATTRQFIEQLYNPRVKEKLVNDLNPLNKVMLHSNSPNSTGENSYLDFKFSRVYEGKDIARILVNVIDVSDAVHLENRLELERSQNDMQIEMLTTILNVQPKIINNFIDNTKLHIDRMNNILKNPGNSQFELEAKLKSIYREMHSLKGEASALKLHTFIKIASEAEDKLHAMQNQSTLSGNDFLPLAVHLDDLIGLSNTIETLGQRINQSTLPRDSTISSHNDEPLIIKQEDDFINLDSQSLTTHSEHYSESFFNDFAQDIASRQHKKVELNTNDVSGIAVPSSISDAVKNISIQLLRNAIVHGIEAPEIREDSGKSATGLITLDFNKSDNQFTITLTDDGQGIDYNSIKERLINKNEHSKQDIEGFSDNELLSMLFSSGFTTRDTADEDGGRGVGLDIVKQHIQELDGKIKINSEKGVMTQFSITLPFKD